MNKLVITTNNDGMQNISVHGDFDLMDCGHILISLTTIFASKLDISKTALEAFIKFLEESETQLTLSKEGENDDVQ